MEKNIRNVYMYSCHSCRTSLTVSSVPQSCPTPRPRGLQHARPPCPSPTPESTQTRVHPVDDAIHPSHPLSSPSPAFNFPAFWVFSSESVLRIRWPQFRSFSFNISPSSEHSGLISLTRVKIEGKKKKKKGSQHARSQRRLGAGGCLATRRIPEGRRLGGGTSGAVVASDSGKPWRPRRLRDSGDGRVLRGAR